MGIEGLMKGAQPISDKIMKEEQSPQSAIEFVLKMVRLLKGYNIKPILVFDGDRMQIKQSIHTEKDSERERQLQLAKVLENQGNYKAAEKAYSCAFKISHEIAHQLIERLRTEEIDFIVVPYEADAQLAYMAINDYVQAVITNDSDLIVFGCPRVIFDIDINIGRGHEFKKASLEEILHEREFTLDMFMQACIFADCDYLKAVKTLRLIDMHRGYEVVSHCEKTGRKFPDDFRELLRKAMMTFKHKLVFHPDTKEMLNLTDASPNLNEEKMDFLGTRWSLKIARDAADGKIHPRTKAQYKKSNKRRMSDLADQKSKKKKMSEFKSVTQHLTIRHVKKSDM